MPICKGCEQKVPYQDLDLHQRYCEGKRDAATGGSDPTLRAAAVEEYVELVESRLVDRLARVDSDRVLPDNLVGVERSNCRAMRRASERDVDRH